MFKDGPLAGKSIGRWSASPTLEGDWPGRYELANIVYVNEFNDVAEIREEYRYNANFTR